MNAVIGILKTPEDNRVAEQLGMVVEDMLGHGTTPRQTTAPRPGGT